MMKEFLQEFIAETTAPPLRAIISDARIKDHGAEFIIAHADDLEGMMYGYFTLLLEEGISVSVILLTLGENGIPGHMSDASSREMGLKRIQELTVGMKEMGVETDVFEFPDTRLIDTPLEKITEAVLPIIRKRQPALLIANSPEKVTVPYINHSDHRRAGEVADRVAEVADIVTFYPHIPKANHRPNVDFLTRNRSTATHYIPLSGDFRKKRMEVIFERYKTQFDPQDKERWKTIFDTTTTYLGGLKHRELYMRQVR